MRLAVRGSVRDVGEARKPARVAAKSVFEVDRSRLGIGVFSRPLLDTECRRFLKSFEAAPMPGFEDFEVDRERVSFVAKADTLPEAWNRIDYLLAAATESVKKAS